MKDKLPKIFLADRFWLTLAFVVSLVRVWLENQSGDFWYWTGAVVVGVLMTAATDWAFRVLDKYFGKLPLLLAVVLFISVIFFPLQWIATVLLPFHTLVIGSHYLQRYGAAVNFQKRIKQSRFPLSRSRIPFPSIASMFARRHGPYALYNLSCCLLN
jgi:hypothetical protein